MSYDRCIHTLGGPSLEFEGAGAPRGVLHRAAAGVWARPETAAGSSLGLSYLGLLPPLF